MAGKMERRAGLSALVALSLLLLTATGTLTSTAAHAHTEVARADSEAFKSTPRSLPPRPFQPKSSRGIGTRRARTGQRQPLLLADPDLKLLTSEQMQFFIRHGYVHLKSKLSPNFNQELFRQVRHLHRDEFNPGNNILPRVDKLQAVLKDGRVRGALTSVLGPDYTLHSHRHVHESFPGKETQPLHQDTYFDYRQQHHHVPQWAMVFYYLQDTTIELGPTGIVNGSQYDHINRPPESQRMPLLVEAGDFVLVHYNIWHGAMANTLAPAIPGTQWRNSKDLIFMKRHEEFTKDPKAYRYMLKLQFVRRVQPGMNGPSWDFGEAEADDQFSPPSTASVSAKTDIVSQHDSDVQEKATSSSTEQMPRITHANCHLPCNVDPTGIGDGLCDDDGNNCRCDWDGGDCDDPQTAVVRADDSIASADGGSHTVHAHARRQGRARISGDEGTSSGRGGDTCDIASLVNDRGALHAHLWEWVSGGAALVKGPCRDAAASEEVLRSNLPALAAQMGDRTVVFSKRLAAAYAIGLLGRRVQATSPALFTEASLALLAACYLRSPDADRDEAVVAGMDAAMYGLTSLGPGVVAALAGRAALGRTLFEGATANMQLDSVAVRAARNLGRSCFIIGNLLTSGPLCQDSVDTDVPCYWYPALLATDQLLRTATAERVPAVHRRDAIEALGSTLSRLIDDASALNPRETYSSTSKSSTSRSEDNFDDDGFADVGGTPGASSVPARRSSNTVAQDRADREVARVTDVVRADGSVVRARSPQGASFRLDGGAVPLLLAESRISSAVARKVGLDVAQDIQQDGSLDSGDDHDSEGNSAGAGDLALSTNPALYARISDDAFRQAVWQLVAEAVEGLSGIVDRAAHYEGNENYKGERGTKMGKRRFMKTQCRFMALYALGQLGPHAAAAVPTLAAIAADVQDDRYVRSYAMEALRQIGTLEALRSLTDIMVYERWDPQTNIYTTF